MAIADSEGKIHDFAGPYMVNTDDFMVRSVPKLHCTTRGRTKTWPSAATVFPFSPLQLCPRLATRAPFVFSQVGCVLRYAPVSGPGDEGWDAAIERADAIYNERMHNICCDNCHHHTALALTESGRPHTLLSSWIYCCLYGRCNWCFCC